ncbi:MAG: GspE/PulE family protein [Thermoleophilaceae bacterium]
MSATRYLHPAPTSGAEAEAPETDKGIGITAPRASGRKHGAIGDVLVELGFIPAEQLQSAIAEGKKSDRTPERVLIESGGVTADQLARATAERFGLDHVDLTVYKPDPSAVSLVTPQAVRRYQAVPIGFDPHGLLLVAMADPSNVLALDDLKLMTGHEMRAVVASQDDIVSLIARMKRLEDAVAEAVEEEGEGDEPERGAFEIRESAEEGPTAKLVNSIILQAIEDGASDVHFEPGEGDMRVRFRVDGMLSESTQIPRRMVSGVISRVKITGDLDISERRLPQDGRVSLKVAGRAVDIRIATTPSVKGEGIVMRLLDKDKDVRTLETLGMSKESRAAFEEAIKASYGAVLATGPTGCGKSTTLYAALSAINSPERKILTIEDPVEYQLAGVSQIQVSGKAGLTFPTGLRAILRSDPDVIMVGEIRDGETARIACQSALTGHLVLSTLHTNDAASSITRLTEMGIEPFMTASAVDCVVAQRLARTLCSQCKRPTPLKADALQAAGFEIGSDVEAFEPGGCARCGMSGYKGRLGLYEVMPVTDEIRSLAVARATAEEIAASAVANGMRTLRDDGLDKVRLGLTSITEVSRVT